MYCLNALRGVDIFNYEDLNICYLRTKDYKFITEEKKSLIINNEGKKIAEIDATSKAFLVDDVLYDWQDKKLIAIDLKKVLIPE